MFCWDRDYPVIFPLLGLHDYESCFETDIGFQWEYNGGGSEKLKAQCDFYEYQNKNLGQEIIYCATDARIV